MMHMTGTRTEATSPIRLMPPMITVPTARARSRPKATAPASLPSHGALSSKVFATWAKAWFDWYMLPPPKLPPMHITAKTTARKRPSPPRPISASPSLR